MSDARYPCRSLIDMARIPPDAWPRLAAELPVMLAVVAPMVALYDEAREAGADVPDEAYDRLLAMCDWIDDDKGTVDVTVTGREADGTERFRSTHHFTIPPVEG